MGKQLMDAGEFINVVREFVLAGNLGLKVLEGDMGFMVTVVFGKEQVLHGPAKERFLEIAREADMVSFCTSGKEYEPGTCDVNMYVKKFR